MAYARRESAIGRFWPAIGGAPGIPEPQISAKSSIQPNQALAGNARRSRGLAARFEHVECFCRRTAWSAVRIRPLHRSYANSPCDRALSLAFQAGGQRIVAAISYSRGGCALRRYGRGGGAIAFECTRFSPSHPEG